MKHLQVSAEQRNKLEEMVKELFPKTPHLFWGKNWYWYDIQITNYGYGEPWDEKNKPQLIYNFHWFEFLIGELSKKVFFAEFCEEAFEEYLDFVQETLILNQLKEHYPERIYIHPIDDLYVRWKNLNK